MMRNVDVRDGRGQVLVMTALLLPVFLALGSVVVGVGNWYTHGRHLQTKADASALAGGGAWQIPCASDIDARIEAQAREYVGPHTDASGAVQTTGYNPQVGAVSAQDIHARLNASNWYDDDSNPGQVDQDSPNNPSICSAMTLDVKVTESNSFPLASILPLFPDIKRKARVEIREVEGLSGLLPIAVRFPKPESIAAVYYNEANGQILAAPYMEEGAVLGLPTDLRGYTHVNDWASFQVPSSARVGVVIAASLQPACDASATPPITTNCFDNTVGPNVNDLCRQPNGTGAFVECFYSTGNGSTQTVQAGLHFIRGYDNNPNTGVGPPVLRTVYLEDATFTTGCPGNGYFNASSGTCQSIVHAAVDVGNLMGEYPNPSGPPSVVTQPLRASDVEVRYKAARADGSGFLCDYGTNCDLLPANASVSANSTTFRTTGSSISRHLDVPRDSKQNAVTIQIRIRNAQNSPNTDCRGTTYSNNCRWWYTANGNVPEAQADSSADVLAAPVQRAFMGDIGDHTPISGPVKFMRVTQGQLVSGSCSPTAFDPDAASAPIGVQRCFLTEMGMRGGVARDQDEPPVVFNLSGTSQSALLDCDPTINHGQISQEIVAGCQTPTYAPNSFDTNPLCPPMTGPVQWFQLPKPAPHDDWAPFTCVFTRTQAAAQQMLQGFIERITGSFPNGGCPPDNALFVPGRNYWHDANNAYTDGNGVTDAYTFAQDNPPPARGNRLRSDDPRLVNFFMTAYDSFNGQGNQVYPIARFGSFYVTGFGRITGGGFLSQWHDPCDDGNSDPSPGAGNKVPPDFDDSVPGSYVWGHFVDNVVPAPNATPSDRACQVGSGVPCVAVLVE